MSRPIVHFTDYTIAEAMDLEQQVLDEIGAEIVWGTARTEQDVLDQIGDPDAVVTQWAPVTRAVIERLTRCKVISRNGIGVDNIDLEAARERGIPVVNVPAYCIPEVADHAMALALALARKLPLTQRTVAEGKWDHSPQKPLWRLSEQTFGIIGLGKIGSAVARRAKPFFKEVIACDPYIAPQCFIDLGVCISPCQEVFERADILSLHVPLTEETRHLVNAETLGLMKPTAILVNTCRGPVVDAAALTDALLAGKIAAAGLDVFETEPAPMDSPLRRMENVILTPHSAFYSEESVAEVRRQTCENIVAILTGREPISRVV